MSISEADFQRIRELLAKSVQTSLESGKDSPAEQVACLNIDYFKVAY